MSLQMTFQALPDDTGLATLIATQPELAEDVALIPYWLAATRMKHRQPGPERDSPLFRWLQQLTWQIPSLADEQFSLDSHWDSFHYVLSATRRYETPSISDEIFDQILREGTIFSHDAQGGQGIPVRWVPPAVVAQGNLLLQSLPNEWFLNHVQLGPMVDAGVYKLHPEQSPDDIRQGLTTLLMGFRQFLQNCSLTHRGLLVVLD